MQFIICVLICRLMYIVSYEGYEQEELRTVDEIEEVELFEEDEVTHYDKTKHLFGPVKETKKPDRTQTQKHKKQKLVVRSLS